MRVFILSCLTLFFGGMINSVHAQEFDITEIVSAKSAYDEAQTETRRAALLLALANYQGEPTVETVNAHLTVVSNDTLSGNNDHARESAVAATQHLAGVAEIVPQQYAETKFIAAIALFNSEKESAAIIEMTHVHEFALAQRDEIGERPEWADALRWKADAWRMAMQSYFESENEKYPSDDEISKIVAAYRPDESSAEDPPIAEFALPWCEGRIVQRPKLRYPSDAQRNGVVGAVIVGFDLDSEGKVINPNVLASIPTDTFEEATLKTISKWRYRADKRNQIGSTCQLNRTNIVIPLTFLFE